jgi:phosphoenolpyruvate synthase/pyruvate phosphate dikinase
MDQLMPGSQESYWQYLQSTFTMVAEKRAIGRSAEDIEALVLNRLMALRLAIQHISFLPEFVATFKERFQEEFGLDFGKVPVFIRSDTNMEDLKDFTGAGLNLTVFNVLDEEKIWQAIRDVWASPYTERSYRWRQKFLLNPENVFPSILVIPGVNVEKSGVMITTGVSSGEPKDITVAFSRGVGGAVEGQIAETYLLSASGTDYLLSPARENKYMVLSENGGTQKQVTQFNLPILKPEELAQLRQFAEQIRKKLPGTPGIESQGPFDVELGFKDNSIWLFQVRPYVENKKARSSEYLQSLDPPINRGKIISLNREIF